MRSLVFDMRSKQHIVFYVFAIEILLCASCSYSPSSSPKSCSSTGPTFDCGASSLFGLCSKEGINVSYDKCLALLPRSSKGSNMLEFKRAIQYLGFDVRAERLSAKQTSDINMPCVILLMPPQPVKSQKDSRPLGHYLVLWPVDSERIEILDYPRPSVTIARNFWQKHLQTVGIDNIPALLCTKQSLVSYKPK